MSRLTALRWLVVMGLGCVLLRLVHLQGVHGARYRGLADRNRLRVVPEEAPRGLIVDRHGVRLADNQTVFRLALVPQEVESLERVMAPLSELVGVPVDQLRRRWQHQQGLPFVPATIVPKVPKPIALRLEERRLHLPGVVVLAETVRRYPRGRSAAHLIGYLGKPMSEELPLLKQYGVHPQHVIGRTGVERAFEAYLRGRSGGTVVEVDHRTRRVRRVGYRTPEPGETVALTIDAHLQSLIETAFGEQPGAAVVLQPRTGMILAVVSLPAFDPAAFVDGSTDDVQRYLTDPSAPLMNRAVSGLYTPGSIAKLVSAGAALEHGLLDPSRTTECEGALQIGDRLFHCWNREGHGPVHLLEAIRASCNVYFLQVGRQLGARRLTTAMSRVGWGRPAGWPLDADASGHLPKRWLTEGEVAMLAIGQGELLVTPLQVAIFVSALANDGWLIRPSVVQAVGGRSAGRLSVQRLGWSPETLKTVRAGMREAVAHPEGTAHRAWTPQVSVAGKTGTAQTHLPGRPHGWFIGFCPIEEPQAAMAIVSEHGGSGGDLAAEIGRAICEYLSIQPT